MRARTRQALSRAAVAVITVCALQACTRSAQWTDEVLLHDGRTIEVAREVRMHWRIGSELTFGRLPDQYGFTAKNPDTGTTLHWMGDRGFEAAVLDFWERTPYLVIVSMYSFADLRQYGCPDIPYVFFRHDEHAGEWRQIAAKDFPPALLHANLRLGYREDQRTRWSHEEIERDNRGSGTSGHFTPAIPTDFASWPSRYKNEYRVQHYSDGCRDSVPSNADPAHPQSPGHDAPAAGLEILETQTFEPDKVLSESEWRAQVRREQRCDGLVRHVGDESDKPELRGWLLFVNDPTGTRKALETGPMLCDADALWFLDYRDRKYVFLAKFTLAGEFVYRVKFARPPVPSNYYLGFILPPSFRTEAGFVYFEWWISLSGSTEGAQRLHQVQKVRFREPSGSR